MIAKRRYEVRASIGGRGATRVDLTRENCTAPGANPSRYSYALVDCSVLQTSEAEGVA